MPFVCCALGFEGADEMEELVFDFVMKCVECLEVLVGDEMDTPQTTTSGERLGQGTFGDVKELQVFWKTSPTVAFSNVGRDRLG